MKTSIGYLKKAKDFTIITKKDFDYSFNEYRGGNFRDSNIPAKILAYSVEWDDWSRKIVIWLSEFQTELETCENEEQVLRKISEIQNREYYLRSKAKLSSVGFSEIQIKKFFNCKNAGWKYEQLELKLELINYSIYPKELFKELSLAYSNAEFDKIAKNWALGCLCGFSHPRKTAYAQLIYQLKK